jgi:signal transduction histidine kinase
MNTFFDALAENAATPPVASGTDAAADAYPHILYSYIFDFSAIICLVLVAILIKRNWMRLEGWLCAVTTATIGMWLFGLGHYFMPIKNPDEQLLWARVTLSCAMLIPVFYLHTMVALVGRLKDQRWALAAAYVAGALMVGLIWSPLGNLRTEPRAFLHHYVVVKPWYPLLMAQIMSWPIYTIVLMVRSLKTLVGFKKLQILYLIFITVAMHLTTSTVLMPMQANVNMPPYGMILVPMELMLLGYAFLRVRLMDFSQAASRILLLTITGTVAVLVGLVPIVIMGLVRQDYFTQDQIFLILALIIAVAVGVAYFVPKLSPYLEETVRGRLFSQQYQYQQSMLDIINKLTQIPDVQTVLDNVLEAALRYVGVHRAAIYLEDPITGDYVLRAESPPMAVLGSVREVPPSAALIKRLHVSARAIVYDELMRQSSLTLEFRRGPVIEDMDSIGAKVIVPLVHKDWVAGFLALDNRRNGAVFTTMDIELLETLGRETAVALHHRRKEQQIMSSERLITLGTVAAGIAHEVRNPLASISTFAALMGEKGDDPKFREEFSKIVQSDVERIKKVISTVLAFSRPSNVDTQPCDINEVVKQALSLAKPGTQGKQAFVTTEFKPTPPVQINEQQIVQVIINLLSNAMDAVPVEGGRIKVSTYLLTSEGERNPRRGQNYVVVEVTDNGQGIPPNIQERLFQPFYTTKKGGTGLGLAISQKIANDHGGFILLESKVGVGTTFCVHLPVASGIKI